MKPSFSQDIRFMRFLGSAKQTYADRFVIDFYFGQPFAVLFADAKKTAFATTFAPVLRIFGVRNFAEIGNRIVGAVSVNVVDLIYRPLAVNIKPSQTMCIMQSIVETNADIAVFHAASDDSAHTATSPCFSPRKHACVRVVAKKFVQSFWGHAVNINSALCGGQAW